MNDALLLTFSLMWLDRLAQQSRSAPPASAAPTSRAGAGTAAAATVSPPPVPSRPVRQGLPPMTAVQSLLPGATGFQGGDTLARGRELAPPPTDIVCEAPDAQPVGQVRVTPSGQKSILIENLRVEEPYRGQGLGRELISEAFELGQRWGCGRAWLVADDRGSGRLLRWYQTLGFLPTGRRFRNRPVLEASLRQKGSTPRQRRIQGSRPFAFTFRAQPVVSWARTPPRESV